MEAFVIHAWDYATNLQHPVLVEILGTVIGGIAVGIMVAIAVRYGIFALQKDVQTNYKAAVAAAKADADACRQRAEDNWTARERVIESCTCDVNCPNAALKGADHGNKG